MVLERGRGRGRGRGHIGQNHFYGRHHNFGRGQPFGRGRSYNRNRGRGRNYNHVPQENRTQPHNKLKMTKHDAGPNHSENLGGSCYRCGSEDHWSRTCRIPPHLCQLYKESLKGKVKKEVNLVDDLKLDNLELPNTDLNVSDFFNDVVLKRFNMDKANPLSIPIVVRSLSVDNDPYRPCKENEEVLGPEVSYLSAIGALMYLTNCTRPDIYFAQDLIHLHKETLEWNQTHIPIPRGTVDLGLFYSNNAKEGLLGYADAGYLSDSHKARSQTGYVFMNGGTAISWRSQKQTLVATSSNHAEVIALHEASRECVWLRSMTQLIVTSCGLEEDRDPTLIYEDNAACVTQMKEGYIKSDRTKHIPPRFFSYTQDLMKSNQVEIKYV
ncbi:hypothetical protein OSB04_028208 [Centaurea solstitialis]|uniref:CCHC-type domain-containing protein n=1 Tax=Centaurea solstitialis TaxID=347529 RepID=A0AA38VXG5_9ASTR|nr:hypothetical protein OSB04_028208 [Centaurea solstitialis]